MINNENKAIHDVITARKGKACRHLEVLYFPIPTKAFFYV